MSKPETSEPKIVRVNVDTCNCLVHAMCEDICPQVFKTNDDGTIVVPGAEKHFDSQRAQIIEAADVCPIDIIRIAYDDGTIT